MSETVPNQPTAVDVSCQLQAIQYDISQARTLSEFAERAHVARTTHARLNDIRALVPKLNVEDQSPIQAILTTVTEDSAQLMASVLPETETAPPSEEPLPAETPPPAARVGFVKPYPHPTNRTQQFDNAIAWASYQAGQLGTWIRERFQHNPSAAPLLTAVGTTAVFGLFRSAFGGSGNAVTAAVETQVSTQLNTMASSVASINIPPTGVNILRNQAADFVLTPPTAAVSVNGRILGPAGATPASSLVVGALTITRTADGIRVVRSVTPGLGKSVTLTVGTSPSAITRTLRLPA